MLTPKETEGLTTVLQSLSLEKLLAVARTTTKNMIKFETSKEAVLAILTYTEKPSDLLRRQKITKQIIFDYLRSTGTVVSVNVEKKDYVHACLRLWGSQDSIQDDDILDDQEESCGRSGPTHVQVPNAVALQECQNMCSMLGPGTVEKLSMEFLVWFFDSLNRLDNFGSNHFWPDCKFYIVIKTPPNTVAERCVQNADCVAQAFYDFIMKDQIYFNPNIAKDAIKFEEERHGLIKISVGGVVHKNSDCIGIFDFFFGLIRDPAFNNNWKIKIVRLDSQVTSNGCVMPNSVSGSAISLPMLA